MVPDRARCERKDHSHAERRRAEEECGAEGPAGARRAAGSWSQEWREDERGSLREDGEAEEQAADEPHDNVSRPPMCTECRHGQRHEQSHLHVAVSVLADQDDRDGVERDADEQGTTHSESLGPGRDERQVERDHERRLDRDEVEAKDGPEAEVDEVGRVVETDDDHEPERRPVQDAGLVRVRSFVLSGERPAQ